MPPRHAYWTILVDGQPTAFRAALQEDLMPTFKRLKDKHPSAAFMWFQNGRLWPSRLDAQEAMRERGERGRSADPKQGGFRARKKSEWRPREEKKPEWRPREEKKPEWRPREQRPSAGRPKLDWQPRGDKPRLEWKPKGEAESRARGGELRPSRPSPRSGRDKNWRPGGAHKDPRQKYKDAKKAKWQRFKKTIRTRWEAGQGKKRRDEES